MELAKPKAFRVGRAGDVRCPHPSTYNGQGAINRNAC
jgi:hypothetical protein